MSTIQIRDVPEQTHRVLKSRAARAGMSLSDYLLNEVNRMVSYMSWQEFADLTDELFPDVESGTDEPQWSAADAVRQGRLEREAELLGRVGAASGCSIELM